MIENIILIFGGVSGEHEVSCISARFIEKTIQQTGKRVIPVYIDKTGTWYKQSSTTEKPVTSEANQCQLIKNRETWLELPGEKIRVDFAFPIIHGTTGEDGKLQGYLELLDIPYAGAGVLSSALCMDKYYSKRVFDQNNIPQVKFIKVDKSQWNTEPAAVVDLIAGEFTFPLFIKPSNMGSSVGVSRVTRREELQSALNLAFEYDDQILCEQGYSVREIELSILGNYPDYQVSIPGEIIPSHEFYDYEAKYLDKEGAQLVIPAKLEKSQIDELQNMARQSFKAVKGDGFARIDFFIDKTSGSIYLNEINTLPGFTPISMFPMLWEKSGLAPTDLIDKIIQLGAEKFKNKKQLRTSLHT